MKNHNVKVMNSSVDNRIFWVDNAKAIGIILVMLGHTKGNFAHSTFIYSFHMPLFFFCSGYLVNKDSLKLHFKSYAKRLQSKLVIPYIFFWIVSYIYWLLVQQITKSSLQAENYNFNDAIFGLVYGINNYLRPNVVLWFFTCLFMTSIIFYFYNRFFKRILVIPIAATISIVSAYLFNESRMRLPWNFDGAVVVVLFYTIGYYCRESRIIDKLFRGRFYYNVIFFLVSSAVLYFTVDINGTVVIANLFLQNPILFYLHSALGILMIIFISHIIPCNKYCKWISSNTLTLFCLHQLFFSIFTGIGILVFHMSDNFNTHPIIYISYIILSLILSIPISFILRQYFPWAIGLKSS